MAIANYSDLITTLPNWIHRTDLDPLIPDFIYLAECKISNNIKARQLETSVDLPITQAVGYVVLPTDYGSLKNITIAGSYSGGLIYVPDETLLKYNSNGVQGTPQFYTIQGDNIMLSPVPSASSTLKVIYYRDLQKLSSINPTNWVLTKYPYIYLYGALIEASIHTKDPDQVQFYQAKFDDAIKDIWQNFAMESFSGSGMTSVSDYIM